MENLPKISPESLTVANTYLATGSVTETAYQLDLSPDTVSNYLAKREVKQYVDQVFLDQGYRNRSKLFALMEEIIESKLSEARESEIYSSKDLLDILAQYHKMRMDEIKVSQPRDVPHTQINVQNNHNDGFPGGKYGDLLRKLHGSE